MLDVANREVDSRTENIRDISQLKISLGLFKYCIRILSIV